MPNPLTPEERAARDRFLAEHGAQEIPRGTYTEPAIERQGRGRRGTSRVVGTRIVGPGESVEEARVVPTRQIKAGRGRVPVEAPGRRTPPPEAEPARPKAAPRTPPRAELARPKAAPAPVPPAPAAPAAQLPAPAGPAERDGRAAEAVDRIAGLTRALREDGDRTALAETLLAERDARIAALNDTVGQLRAALASVQAERDEARESGARFAALADEIAAAVIERDAQIAAVMAELAGRDRLIAGLEDERERRLPATALADTARSERPTSRARAARLGRRRPARYFRGRI